MKSLFVLFVVANVYCTNIFCQEKVFETTNVYSKPSSKKNESFALLDQKNGDLMLIMSGKTSVKGVLLDSLFQEKNRINAEPLPSKYKHFVGYNIIDKTYSILFTNHEKSKFGVLQFNTNNNSFVEKKLAFKLKKELFIESIIYNNEIFLFTITKRSSELNIYKFNKNFIPEKHSVSLEKVEFPRTPGSSIILSAYTLLTRNPKSFDISVQDVSKIESNNPNVIETTSKKIKIYQENNIAIFTFDSNPDKTDLFYINLDSFKLSHNSYDKASKEKGKYKKNNSYLFDNKLFQLASSDEIMNFRIIDLKTDKIIQDYYVGKKDSITFKNSSIILGKTGSKTFGLKIDKTKEIEKTSEFLKNISFANLGISVYKTDDIYNITLGGTKEYVPDRGLIIAIAVLGANTHQSNGTSSPNQKNLTPTYTYFNPTFYDYYSYGATKSTYINCLFDKEFKHSKGPVPLNVFDIINEFEDNLENLNAVNIFNHKNKLYYNYLDKEHGKFQLFQFK